jgi:hypothetical protein
LKNETEPSITEYMSPDEREEEYQRLLERMKDDRPLTAAEQASEALRYRRFKTRGKYVAPSPVEPTPLPAAPVVPQPAPIVRVHMHGDEPVEAAGPDKNRTSSAYFEPLDDADRERWSDRSHPVPHDEPLDDSELNDCGDLGSAPEAPEPAHVVERKATRKSAETTPWWIDDAPAPRRAPEPEEIDPMSMTSEQFWSQPVWRATSNHARWTLWDQSNGRCPMPPEPRP